jgi:hypothetical protein
MRKDRRNKANGSQSRIYERTYVQDFGAKRETKSVSLKPQQ